MVRNAYADQHLLRYRCTSSRRADRHLMSVLKSPLPRTFRSSQFVRTSDVVRLRLRHLKQTLVINFEAKREMDILFFFICLKRNFVYTSEEGDWVGSLDKVSSCTLLEQRVISVLVAVSSPAFLLGLEDIRLEVVGRCALVDR